MSSTPLHLSPYIAVSRWAVPAPSCLLILGIKAKKRRGEKTPSLTLFSFPFSKTLHLYPAIAFPRPLSLHSPFNLGPLIPSNLSPTSSWCSFPTDTLVPSQDRQQAPGLGKAPSCFLMVEQHRKSIFSNHSYPRHIP